MTIDFSNMSEKEFFGFFKDIFERGKKDSTYKFAFARFLVDYSNQDNPKSHVEFSTISEYFLKYFWPQVCRSNLKHNGHSDTEPTVVKSIKTHFTDLPYTQNYEQIKKKYPEKIKKCIEELSNPKLSSTFCFGDVTYAFQRIGNDFGNDKFFHYEDTGKKNKHRKNPVPKINGNYGIDIIPNALVFFKKHNYILGKIVILEWSRFLEKFNLNTPKIIEKTEGGNIERDLAKATKFRKILLESGFNTCFYNGSHHLDKIPSREIHADHVIPFDYIREDEIWNYVLACQECNCKKSAYLPPKIFLQKLIDRNSQEFERIPELKISLKKIGNNYPKIIRKHYQNALDDGFKMKKDFP